MIRRFSHGPWRRREKTMHSPELKAWIARVLRDAARRPGGIAELQTPEEGDSVADPGYREIDNEAGCRSLDGHGTIFIPKCYEEKYPYPLIVWLNERERTQPAFQDFLFGLSDRNYLGFSPDESVAANIIEAAGNGSSKNRPLPIDALSQLHDAVRAIRRDLNIHTERIFLAGAGRGGNAALSMFLARPNWFGGAVVLDGSFPEESLPLGHLADLRQKRVFLANSADAEMRSAPLAGTVAVGRLLNSAGVSVTTRGYDSPNPLAPGKLSDINEWVMEGVCAPA